MKDLDLEKRLREHLWMKEITNFYTKMEIRQVFMDEKTFNCVNIPNEIIGDDKLLLKENINAVLEFYDEKPISVSLPKQLEYEILETDAVVKGQTVSSSVSQRQYKNNLKIMNSLLIKVILLQSTSALENISKK